MMDAGDLVRFLLLGVFAVSALAKISSWSQWMAALGDFDVSPSHATPIGVLVVIGELVVAVLLAYQPWSFSGALLAIAELVVFSAVIAYSLVQGTRPVCHCFGPLSRSAISIRDIVRNMLLIMVAMGILLFG